MEFLPVPSPVPMGPQQSQAASSQGGRRRLSEGREKPPIDVTRPTGQERLSTSIYISNGYSRRPSPGRSVPGDRRTLDGAAFASVSQATASHGSDATRRSRSRGVDADGRFLDLPAQAGERDDSRLSGDGALGRSGVLELDAPVPLEPGELAPRQLFKDSYELSGEL